MSALQFSSKRRLGRCASRALAIEDLSISADSAFGSDMGIGIPLETVDDASHHATTNISSFSIHGRRRRRVCPAAVLLGIIGIGHDDGVPIVVVSRRWEQR